MWLYCCDLFMNTWHMEIFPVRHSLEEILKVDCIRVIVCSWETWMYLLWLCNYVVMNASGCHMSCFTKILMVAGGIFFFNMIFHIFLLPIALQNSDLDLKSKSYEQCNSKNVNSKKVIVISIHSNPFSSTGQPRTLKVWVTFAVLPSSVTHVGRDKSSIRG